jgi:hypothetical protein
MWIRTLEGLDCFVKTVDEGQFTWSFDGELYVVENDKQPLRKHISSRCSLSMLAVRENMPKLYAARKAWLDRKLEPARKLDGYVD